MIGKLSLITCQSHKNLKMHMKVIPVWMVYIVAMLNGISSAETNGSKLLLPKCLMCLNQLQFNVNLL